MLYAFLSPWQLPIYPVSEEDGVLVETSQDSNDKLVMSKMRWRGRATMGTRRTPGFRLVMTL